MKKRISVAIIGCGVVGKRRKKFIEKNNNYSLNAISDIRFKKKKFFKNKIYHYKYYTDLLAERNLDAVFVTLPNYLASKVTIQCIKKRINVFCEKPPAKNVKEIKRVKDISEKFPSVKIKYGFNHRYHASVKMAKDIIKGKDYGDVLNFRCLYGKSKIVTYGASEWRSKKKYSGGGILIDQGIHLLDLLRFFNGNFYEYKSFISNKFWNYDVEDNAFALMRDKKGVIASIHSTATQWQHKFRIEIALRYALLELKGILSGSKSYGRESLSLIPRFAKSKKNSKAEKKFIFKKDTSWKEEVDEFAKIILNKLSVKTGNIDDALEVMKMVDSIYKTDNKWR